MRNIELLEEYIICLENNDTNIEIIENLTRIFYDIKVLKLIPVKTEICFLLELSNLNVFPPIINYVFRNECYSKKNNKLFIEFIINFLNHRNIILKNSKKNFSFPFFKKTILSEEIDKNLIFYISSFANIIPLSEIIYSFSKEDFIAKEDSLKLKKFSEICSSNDSEIMNAIFYSNILTPYLKIIEEGISNDYSIREIFVYIFKEI